MLSFGGISVPKPEKLPPFVFSISPHTHLLFRELQKRFDTSDISAMFVVALLIVGDMIERWKKQESPSDFFRWFAAISEHSFRAAVVQFESDGHKTEIVCPIDLEPADRDSLFSVWMFLDVPLQRVPRLVIECAYYHVHQLRHELPDNFPQPFPPEELPEPPLLLP